MFQERYNQIVLPFFFLFDTLIVISLYLIINFYFGITNSVLNNLFIIIPLWIIVSIFYKSYKVPRVQAYKVALIPVFYAWSTFTLIFTLLLFLNVINITSNFSQGIFILSLGLIHHSICLGRYHFFRSYRSKGKNIRYAVLLGNLKANQIEKIEKDGLHFGYSFIGFLSTPNIYLEELKKLISKEKLNIVFLQTSDQLLIDKVSEFCDDNGIRLKLLLSLSESTSYRAGLDLLGGLPIMDIRHEPLLYLGNRMIKRIIDIVMSIISILLVLTWLPIIVKVAQFISYPGPLFFIQERIGHDGKVFKLYKFRTMYFSNQIIKAQKGQAEKTKENDRRIPFFGRLLRSTNLDEYPQFINVLFGSMSTVGPRPHMLGEDSILEKKVNRYRIRRFVKPGITGWAAINGYRGGTDNMNLMLKRTELDIWYLENWSLLLDLKIILLTIWQMVTLKIPKAY